MVARIRLRRLLPSPIWAAFVTVLVALAVPVAGLRVVRVDHWCCCPDQSKCKCPGDKHDGGDQPSIRVCHQTNHVTVTPPAPAFDAPVVAIVDVAEARVDVAHAALPQPHAPPSLERPRGPS